MIKSRQRKLDKRWGSETNVKGGRFKLNRDLAGFHDSRRSAIEVREEERGVHLRIDDPPELRAAGTLVHCEDVAVGYAGNSLLGGVTFGLEQMGRVGLVGAVGHIQAAEKGV